MMEPTDQELMRAFKSGDAAGFDELLRRYKGPLFTYLYRLLGDREEANDMFQETFMRVIRKAGTYDDSRPFKAWVYGIAHNLAVDAMRGRKLKEIHVADLPEAAGLDDDPECRAISSQTAVIIERAVRHLPQEQREVFIMREYSGMSFREIAEATTSPLNTVLGRMHLAVKKLKTALADYAGV